MEDIKKVLKEFLRGAGSVVFLAIGSELRADDAAGIECAKELLKNKLPENFKVLLGFTAPENLTGEIRKAKPTHLIICDAANSGLSAGKTSVIETESIDGAAFSTHMMPMNVFINYISQSSPLKTLILGIQPKTLDFGAEISKEVKKSAQNLAVVILETLS
ncbi:hydrogenase 3 maturation endopeptidase HyCI [Endomicrobium proavitum]|uniref:Hydrogenase maturation peptidase HycI hydrogenase maturation protease n=1 Tax=Endomicrobium proavitum TaxID=1408281 RepID=A0A0G3WFI7_9BACT|nr:hydrogenase 3 maturation endopeptidase HyCI [Endomicrobium proavitum]AKL97421.1 Hydrogenase maturation peptidase HycI hydrogenase maturation protease [Endomicrobium proavitum]